MEEHQAQLADREVCWSLILPEIIAISHCRFSALLEMLVWFM